MTDSQTIRILCPNLVCRKILAVPVSARGRTVRCKGCQTNIRIPAGGETAAAEGDKNAKPGAKPGSAAA